MEVYSESSALKEGHSLWIIPDPASSHWNKKIDWYCNLLLARTKSKKAKLITDPYGPFKFDLDYLNNQKLKYTCITAKKNLPCDMIIEVPYSNHTETWLEEIFNLSQSFNQIPLRIFLPQGINTSTVENLWKWNKKHISIVKDQEL